MCMNKRRYTNTYNSLSYNSFPPQVESFLQGTTQNDIIFDFKSRYGSLIGKKEISLLEIIGEFDHIKSKTRLLGYLSTLLWIREENKLSKINKKDVKNFRLNVKKLSGENWLYLEYPGKKSVETWHHLGPFTLDYAVNIENWNNMRGGQTPRHAEIFSDIYWKIKEAKFVRDDPELANKLKNAIYEIYIGRTPMEVLKKYRVLSNFAVGNNLESILHSIYWIAIQEDFNYANYQGRTMSHSILNRICDIKASDFTETNPVFPDDVNIYKHKEYLEIITSDEIKGFEPNNRGELLSVKSAISSEFLID